MTGKKVTNQVNRSSKLVRNLITLLVSLFTNVANMAIMVTTANASITGVGNDGQETPITPFRNRICGADKKQTTNNPM